MMKPLLLILTIFSTLSISAQVTEQDSLALVAFYNSTNGSEWLVDSNWLEGPVGTWHGIEIDSGRVTELNLYDNNLTGSLPSELGDLTGLQEVSISSNAIGGVIPESIGQCSKLEYINIHVNLITDTLPGTFADLTNLRTFIAYKCEFTGGFPEVLLDMPQLVRLELGSNNFVGPIPAGLNDLVNLRTLTIDRNDFSGPMPAVTNLTELTNFHLAWNNLEGQFDTIFGPLPNMYYFTFGGNNFTGCVSETLFNPARLQYLHLEMNDFDCVGDFSAFADTGNLERIYCHQNKIPFEYLEKNADVFNYSYENQDSMGQPATHYLQVGDTIEVDAGTGGDHTSYVWYKDNIAIAGATQRTLTIAGYQGSDAGAYHCEATNAMLPALTLHCHRVHLKTEGTTKTKDLRTESLIAYPNPASGEVIFKGLSGPGTMQIYSGTGTLVKSNLVDVISRVDVSDLSPGAYHVLITSSDKRYTTTLLKL